MIVCRVVCGQMIAASQRNSVEVIFDLAQTFEQATACKPLPNR